MNDPEIPRIYTSFAEFERDERRRLGLPDLPAVTAVLPKAKAKRPPPAADHETASLTLVPVPRPFVRVAVPRPTMPVSITHITPTTLVALRAEGILEIGSVAGTSILFMRTRKKFHVLHATWVPDRQLDDYAVRLAVTWIEDHGMPSCKVAKNLGVSELTLQKALLAAGYDRLSPELLAQQAGTRPSRKIGYRRGRLVHTHKPAGANANA